MQDCPSARLRRGFVIRRCLPIFPFVVFDLAVSEPYPAHTVGEGVSPS
jgi:hypothetical protein